MKYMSGVLIFLFLVSNQESCKKEPICACGVEHPEENLLWLKERLVTTLTVDIYDFSHADTEYVVMSDPAGPDAMSLIFSCEGDLVCEIGGSNPGDNYCIISSSPELFLENYAKRKLIYSKRYN
jgi:hypothetical protein